MFHGIDRGRMLEDLTRGKQDVEEGRLSVRREMPLVMAENEVKEIRTDSE